MTVSRKQINETTTEVETEHGHAWRIEDQPNKGTICPQLIVGFADGRPFIHQVHADNSRHSVFFSTGMTYDLLTVLSRVLDIPVKGF